MLSKDKIERFRAIAREVYTKEYLGIEEYGKDIPYEEELTTVAADYLMGIFNDNENHKEDLLKVMSKKKPINSSNILNIIL